MGDIKIVFISDIHFSPGQDWSQCIWKYTPNEELPGLLDRFVDIVNLELKPDVIIELGDRIIDVDAKRDVDNTRAWPVPCSMSMETTTSCMSGNRSSPSCCTIPSSPS